VLASSAAKIKWNVVHKYPVPVLIANFLETFQIKK
jgi:A/G-specific adenine glycosylase